MLRGLENRSALFLLGLTILLAVCIAFFNFSALYGDGLFLKFLTWSVCNMALSIRALRSPSRRKYLHTLLACFGVFLGFEMVSITVSAHTPYAWLKWISDLQVLIFTVLLVANFGVKNIREATPYLALSILLLMIPTGLYQWIASLDNFVLTHQGTYRVTGGLPDRNLYIQFILLTSALTLPLINEKSTVGYVSKTVLTLSLFLGIALLSRGAWLMSLVVLVGLIVTLRKHKSSVRSPKNKWKYPLVGVILIGAFAFVLDDWYTISHHFETITTSSQGTVYDRVQLLKRSFTLGLENPILGVGVGEWPVAIMSFDQTKLLTNAATIFYQRAHNDFLQVFAESGIFSAVAYVALFILGIVSSLLSWRENRKIHSLSILMAWILFTWVSVTNFPKERMEFLIVLSLLLVITPLPSFKVRLNKALLTATALISVISITAFSFRIHHELQVAELDSAEAHSYPFFYPLDESSRPIEWTNAKRLIELNKTKEAKLMLAQALKSNPYHPHIYFELADLAANDRMTELAMQYVEEALIRTPNYQSARVLQAQLLYEMGRKEKAFISFLEADPYNPSMEYQSFGTLISTDSLINMMDNYPERELFLTIQAMKNTPEWAFGVIQKAAINQLPFPTQTVMEAVYYMFENCETRDCKKVEEIRMKYIPNKDLNLPIKPKD